MPPIRTYNIKHRVKIKDLITGVEKFDLSDDVVSISTNKAYGRASGTWQILLTYRAIKSGGKTGYYSDFIQCDDVITIELDAGYGKGLVPVMVGLVDRVAVTRQGRGINPTRQVKLTGQDMGKLLVKHDIGWDISGAQSQLSVAKQDGAGEQVMVNYISRIMLQTGTAKSLITQLFNIFQRDIKIHPVMNLKFATDDDWQLWNPTLQYIKNTSLWNAMMRVSHAPWNMLSADTDPENINHFNILLERQPINELGYLDRQDDMVHEIEDHEIVDDDIGFSDLERINLLCYWPDLYNYVPNMTVEIVMAHKDLTHVEDLREKRKHNTVKHHGYQAKTIEDHFVPPRVNAAEEKAKAAEMLAAALPRAEVFWNWYKNNHLLKSGTIQVHGRPDIRSGHGLLARQGTTEKYTEYLVEQISHHYSVHPVPEFITCLSVTRGQDAPLAKIRC